MHGRVKRKTAILRKRLWETLARQFTIIFGLASLIKQMWPTVNEHRELLAVIEAGRLNAIHAALDQHITVMNRAVGYDATVA